MDGVSKIMKRENITLSKAFLVNHVKPFAEKHLPEMDVNDIDTRPKIIASMFCSREHEYHFPATPTVHSFFKNDKDYRNKMSRIEQCLTDNDLFCCVEQIVQEKYDEIYDRNNKVSIVKKQMSIIAKELAEANAKLEQQHKLTDELKKKCTSMEMEKDSAAKRETALVCEKQQIETALKEEQRAHAQTRRQRDRYKRERDESRNNLEHAPAKRQRVQPIDRHIIPQSEFNPRMMCH